MVDADADPYTFDTFDAADLGLDPGSGGGSEDDEPGRFGSATDTDTEDEASPDTDTEDEAAPAAPWAAPPYAFPPEVDAAQLTAEAKEEATDTHLCGTVFPLADRQAGGLPLAEVGDYGDAHRDGPSRRLVNRKKVTVNSHRVRARQQLHRTQPPEDPSSPGAART